MVVAAAACQTAAMVRARDRDWDRVAQRHERIASVKAARTVAHALMPRAGREARVGQCVTRRVGCVLAEMRRCTQSCCRNITNDNKLPRCASVCPVPMY